VSVPGYRKFVLAAGLAAVTALLAALAMAAVPFGLVRVGGVALAAALATLATSLAVSGLLVMARQRRMQERGTDWYLELFLANQAGARGRGRQRVRRALSSWLNGHDFLVGDEVVVKSAPEIRATLDAQSALEGLPFQAEMLRHCDRRAGVFGSLDKIYDYGRTRRMRRTRGCVILQGICCDGALHGNCQAGCRFIWKAAWLRHAAPVEQGMHGAGPVRAAEADDASGLPVPVANSGTRYVCQFTELAAASTPLPRWSLLSELRPLVAGNISVRGFMVALVTRLFNTVQGWHRGPGFPPPAAIRPIAPEARAAPLAPGDVVVVRSPGEIAGTLDARNKHRGLWFDRDMLKHCGRQYRVARQVERIIDNVTGEMRQMKTPCLVLEDVYYSGEFQSFNAQHDWLFWREVWLRRPGERSAEAERSPSARAARIPSAGSHGTAGRSVESA
jgi:hypothetical protein